MPGYNGHKNWNHWNISLWINNDEALYSLARECISVCKGAGKTKDQAARDFRVLVGHTKTPDGAPYTFSSVRAAMRGM